jgi:predicted exporter
MLRAPIVRLVELSTRFAWHVILFAIVLASLCAVYAARHFSISTDVRQLFPTDLPWTQRASQFLSSFPQYDVLVIVEAPTPELTEAASAELASALKADRAHIRAVEEPQGDKFFAQNGLLFVPVEQLAQLTVNAQQAGPMMGALAADPSLRGVLGALSAGLMGVENGLYGIDSLAPAMNAGADTIRDVLSGGPAHFSWQSLAGGELTRNEGNHRFIQIAPVLDFKALSPGRAVTNAIAQTARRLHLADDFQARVRITGLVPMNDAQFAAVKENAALNGAVFIGAVLIILWLALHSWRIIVAALLSVTCGLAYSAAFGLFLVGSLNLLSVAFFVLFVGLGIDFGIQL